MTSFKPSDTGIETLGAAENTDLRNQPTYEPRALPSTYRLNGPLATKIAAQLPFGTQAKFIDAAKEAAGLGLPLNTLLTVRQRNLSSHHRYALQGSATPKQIRRYVEHIRKWITRRTGNTFAYIWVREDTAEYGEHWHLALHLPKRLEKTFAAYISKTVGEGMNDHPRQAPKRTEGEWACGEDDGWHIARDTHPERQGRYLAAYLGKGEASMRLFRGKWTVNSRKQLRGGKYDLEQGLIQGTTARASRFDIALPLKQALKRRQQ